MAGPRPNGRMPAGASISVAFRGAERGDAFDLLAEADGAAAMTAPMLVATVKARTIRDVRFARGFSRGAAMMRPIPKGGAGLVPSGPQIRADLEVCLFCSLNAGEGEWFHIPLRFLHALKPAGEGSPAGLTRNGPIVDAPKRDRAKPIGRLVAGDSR
jgi:hypothetical protein